MSTRPLFIQNCARHLFSARFIRINAAALGALVMFAASSNAADMAMAPSPRDRVSFNADWRFTKNDPEGTGDALSYANIKPWFMAMGSEFSTNGSFPRPEGDLGTDARLTRSRDLTTAAGGS